MPFLGMKNKMRFYANVKHKSEAILSEFERAYFHFRAKRLVP